MNIMFPNKRRQSTFIISTLLIVVFSAGLVAAHDTGQPHTHDPVEKVCDNCHAVDESLAPNDGTHAHVFQGLPKDHPPMAIVVASGDGKLYSLQWLLQHLRSIYSATESAAPHRYSHAHQHSHQHSHEHVHSHSHQHSHQHSHEFSIPSACQHHPALQDETGQTVTSTQID